MHLQTLLGDRLKMRAARRRADLSFEPQPLADQAGAPRLERADLSGARDPVRAPQDHPRRDDHEAEQDEGEPEPPARGYLARHARSFALRARGLRAISSGVATVARRVST